MGVTESLFVTSQGKRDDSGASFKTCPERARERAPSQALGDLPVRSFIADETRWPPGRPRAVAYPETTTVGNG
jgi:hypothetical protein